MGSGRPIDRVSDRVTIDWYTGSTGLLKDVVGSLRKLIDLGHPIRNDGVMQ